MRSRLLDSALRPSVGRVRPLPTGSASIRQPGLRGVGEPGWMFGGGEQALQAMIARQPQLEVGTFGEAVPSKALMPGESSLLTVGGAQGEHRAGPRSRRRERDVDEDVDLARKLGAGLAQLGGQQHRRSSGKRRSRGGRGRRLPREQLEARNRRSEERRVGKECRSRWSPYH